MPQEIRYEFNNNMIDYNLARRLKDAGFPQKGFWFYSSDETNTPCLTYQTNPYDTAGMVNIAVGDKDVVAPRFQKIVLCYAPALEELIEACGDRFASLLCNHNDTGWKWRAMANGRFGANVEGTTPEEAVANLWLLLNKKS